ncbi:formylglycine-generating enzyme family protein [Acidobacteriota bacterium]
MKKIIPYIVSLFLVFILNLVPATYGHPVVPEAVSSNLENHFAAALDEYQKGNFRAVADKLVALRGMVEDGEPEFLAKVALLSGACHEKAGKRVEAKTCFLQLKEMLDTKLIAKIPIIKGIDLETFAEYQAVFAGSSMHTFKEPIVVSDMMKRNVVHAPRKTVEQKEKEKKRKKFPWLLAIGGVLVVGTVLVILLTKKKNDERPFTEIDWVYIPEGEFLMGDNFNEGNADEQPVHPVYLDGYYISKYEVSIAQYFFFCDETGTQKPFEYDPAAAYTKQVQVSEPIYGISYLDARAFCQWLSQRTGKNVHLPTEAQWEKAARGTGQIRYPWGSSEPNCDKANYSDCRAYSNPDTWLVAVDTKPAGQSPYGLFHMVGNVREWCLDWYGADYYLTSPAKNPMGSATGSHRVIRGGCNWDRAFGIRSARRANAANNYASRNVGFRVVMEE